MAKNPTIEQLNDSVEFEKIAEIPHQKIKEFIVEQARRDRFLIPVYMFYQVIMVLLGTFFITRAIVLLFRGSVAEFLWAAGALVFSITFLVFIHELLHGLVLLFTGAKTIRFGANLRHFIFFAKAEGHVMNHRQFGWVATTPLFVVKAATLAGVIVYFNQPSLYFFLTVMSTHSLFCAGDIGLLSFFNNFKKELVFTYDLKGEDKSFYFRKINHEQPS